MTPRIGIGYDLHQLVQNRPLILGGVRIPFDRGLQGHSDADIVLHALCDALLGAIGQPDIGELFPDSDPKWSGVDSRLFVAEALGRVATAGLRIGNVDVIIHAQVPRLKPHKNAIRQSIAETCGIAIDQVGLKATTNEGLDAIGRGEALAAWASVLLVSR